MEIVALPQAEREAHYRGSTAKTPMKQEQAQP